MTIPFRTEAFPGTVIKRTVECKSELQLCACWSPQLMITRSGLCSSTWWWWLCHVLEMGSLLLWRGTATFGMKQTSSLLVNSELSQPRLKPQRGFLSLCLVCFWVPERGRRKKVCLFWFGIEMEMRLLCRLSLFISLWAWFGSPEQQITCLSILSSFEGSLAYQWGRGGDNVLYH